MTLADTIKSSVKQEALNIVLLTTLLVSATVMARHHAQVLISKQIARNAQQLSLQIKQAISNDKLESIKDVFPTAAHLPAVLYVRIIDDQQRIVTEIGQQPDSANTASHRSSVHSVMIDGQPAATFHLTVDTTDIDTSVYRLTTWFFITAFFIVVLLLLRHKKQRNQTSDNITEITQYLHDLTQYIRARNVSASVSLPTQNSRLKALAIPIGELVDSIGKTWQTNAETERTQHQQIDSLQQQVALCKQELQEKTEQLEQHAAQQEETMKQLLQSERLASVGELTVGITHEINNQIGFIVSNLNTLIDYSSMFQILMSMVRELDKQAPDNVQKKAVCAVSDFYQQHNFDDIGHDVTPLIEESLTGLKRISNIIEGLKTFSRESSADKQWSDINKLMDTTLSIVFNKLKYVCEVEKQYRDVPTCYIQVNQITQVFTNLLINAGQAIEATGNIGRITVRTYQRNEHVIIEIADNGCGIDEQHKEKLFTPFFTTKPEGQGTGLGLSISYDIIREHGGEINVSSVFGEGTQFCVLLPIYQDATAAQ